MPNFAGIIDGLRDRIVRKFPGLHLGTRKNRVALACLCMAIAAILTLMLIRMTSGGVDAPAAEAAPESVTVHTPDAEDKDILGAEDAIDAFESAERNGGGSNMSGRMAQDMFNSLPRLPKAVSGDTSSRSGGSSYRDEAMRSLGGRTPEQERALAELKAQEDSLKARKEQLEKKSDAMKAERERYDREHRERLIALGYDPDTGQPLSDEKRRELEGQAAPQPSGGNGQDPSGGENPAAAEEEAAPSATVRRSGSVSSLDDDNDWNSVGGVSSLDGESDLVVTDNHPFAVMFTRDEKISSGGRVSVRILEDMVVEGVRIPENTQMSAICTIGDNRLEVKVQALKVNDRIYTLNLVGYDTDGLEGLYCPQSQLNKGARQAKTEAGQIIRSALQSGVAGYAGQVVSSGASVIQSVSGNVTISVTAGYKFYLLKKEN